MKTTNRVLGNVVVSPWVLVLLATILFIYATKPMLGVVAIYSTLVLAVTVVNPLHGTIGVILSLSLTGLKIEAWSFGIEIYSLFAFLLGIGLHLLIYQTSSWRSKLSITSGTFTWYGALVAFVGLSGGLNSVLTADVSSFRTSLHVIALLLFAAIIATIVSRTANGYHWLSFAMVLSFVLAIAVVLKNWEPTQLGLRLRLHENVRALANPTSIAFVILACSLVSRHPALDFALLFSSRVRLIMRFSAVILIVLATIILIGTVSRGAILATVIAVITLVIASPIESQKSPHRLRRVMLFGLLAAGAVGLGVYLDSEVGGGILQMRVAAALRQGTENARIAIWSAAVQNMKVSHWLTGAGPGQFRTLALLEGLDFYAHSVFIDVLVSTGLGGLFVLLTLISLILLKSFWYGNTTVTTLTVFLIMSFLTHGDMQSPYFWAMLGLVHGLASRPPLAIHSREHLHVDTLWGRSARRVGLSEGI